MSVVTLRPDNIKVQGHWDYVGGPNFIASITDNSDASWVGDNAFSGTYTLELYMGDYAFPAGTVINSVKPRIRLGASASGNSYIFGIQEGGAGNRVYSTITTPSGIVSFDGITSTVKPSNGAAWSVADVNALVFFCNLPSWGPSATIQIYEVYVDIDYTTHQPPSTPTGLAVTSAVTNTTPTFQASVSDPDGNQVKARFEVYQSDGITIIGSIDSSYVSGSGVVSATFGSALAVGTYKVKAKAIDNEGMESGYTALLTFQVNVAVNKDYGTLWNVADPTTPVFKDYSTSWAVAQNNTKDIVLRWDTLTASTKDISLRWDVGTAWVDVPETPVTIWTEVTE